MINEAQQAAAEKAIREFDWSNYSLDDVGYQLESDPDAQEWVPALARAVLQSQRGIERWQPTGEVFPEVTGRSVGTDAQVKLDQPPIG